MAAVVVCDAGSLLLSLVLDNENPNDSLAPRSSVLKLRVKSRVTGSDSD